jgi:phenylacetate-CoA ligase
MGMHLKTYSKGLWNLIIRRYTGSFWIRRRWLGKTQWLTQSAMNALQLDLLKRLICHSYHTVPYYRHIMKENGISIKDIRTLADIQRFPILTKKDIIDAGDSLISQKYIRSFLRKAHTGGTTGTPINLYRRLFDIGNEHAFVRRQWDWAGVKLGDICAFLKGRVIESSDRSLYDPVMKELHLSTYHLNIESAKQYIQTIINYKCKALVGYPSSIFILAKANMDMKYTLPIKSILLTSETLSADTKEYISHALGARVYDFYGAAERVCYIFTCERGSYHIQPEYGLTEINPYDTGQYKIISTGFWNYAMPLIRYDTGDMITGCQDTCSCGRSFPIVRQVIGREGDYVITPSGNLFGVSILTHAFHVICGIDCFIESQIVQDEYNHLTVKYIPSRKFNPEYVNEYASKLKNVIDEQIAIDFKRVDSIEKTASGKHKFVVSMLPTRPAQQ